jgi:hypothetical protein
MFLFHLNRSDNFDIKSIHRFFFLLKMSCISMCQNASNAQTLKFMWAVIKSDRQKRIIIMGFLLIKSFTDNQTIK